MRRGLAIFLGVVLAIAAVSLGALTAQKLIWPVQSAEAEGTVTAVSRSAQGDPCCAVEVLFFDAEGHRHEFRSDFGGDRSTQRGDTITVYYDPDNPLSADTGWGRFKSALIPALIGLSVTVVAVMMLLAAKRRPRTSGSDPANPTIIR